MYSVMERLTSMGRLRSHSASWLRSYLCRPDAMMRLCIAEKEGRSAGLTMD